MSSKDMLFDDIMFLEWRQSEKAHPGRSFIDLPRELRDMIYQFCLTSTWKQALTPCHIIRDWPWEIAEPKNFSLMSVSRQCMPVPLSGHGLRKMKNWIWAICDEATSTYPNLESFAIEVPRARACKRLAREPMWNEWKALRETDRDGSLDCRIKLFGQMLNDFGNGEKLFPDFVKLILRGDEGTPWGLFTTETGRAFQKDFEKAFARRAREKASKIAKVVGKKRKRT
ncbi:hypothetical protein FKW77_004367 [Venturia effusa]|uniref:Uncharacterized protein n=1 Tax=Venturia effusa TaxID=50376 RepID=A0A517LMP4_9PEZI|nr:hypothetical protein FKW77_004367 [Venturia effusa]